MKTWHLSHSHKRTQTDIIGNLNACTTGIKEDNDQYKLTWFKRASEKKTQKKGCKGCKTKEKEKKDIFKRKRIEGGMGRQRGLETEKRV